MTNDVKTIAERFAERFDEYLKFDRIPATERLHPNPTLCGYLKLASLLKNPDSFTLSAEHDIVYLTDEDDLAVPLSDADLIFLYRCGISWNEKCACFSDFT